MTDQESRRDSPRDNRRLKKRLRLMAFIAVIVAAVLAAWGIASRLHTRAQLRKHTAEDAVMSVVTVKPDSSDPGDELVLPGIVQAITEASIYARTSGYVKAWRTDIGARVKKGQVLAEIDTPEVDRQLAQARADLVTAQANLALSRTTNQRWQGLLKTNSVSRQDADDKAGDTSAKTAIADSAAQNVARLKDLESFKHVVAPFDGVVTARNTDVGSLVNAGQSVNTQLFQMANTDRLRIYAQVPEAYASAAKTGQKAELHFSEHPDKTYPVETVRTSSALDPSARTLQVELQLDNKDGEVFPGAYAEIHFKMPAAPHLLRVPANTVLFRSDGLQVATVDQQNRIKVKNVIQGRDFGKTVEIISGIDAQDNVVINPSDSITDGVKVRLSPPPDDDKDKKDR